MTFLQAFSEALHQLITLDGDLFEIVTLSLQVSLLAALSGTLLGLGLALALYRRSFFAKRLVELLIITGMGLPPIVIGLIVFVLLSNSGPFGQFELLYTVFAMVLAQSLIVIPIVAGLSGPILTVEWKKLRDLLLLLGARSWQIDRAILWEARHRLGVVCLAGFGRVIGEVGATTIVGGNILHFTRTMTGAIRLEASKGDLSEAIALGMILLLVAFLTIVLAHLVAALGRLREGAKS